MPESEYDSLRPATKKSVHGILSQLGYDLSEWNNVKGGVAKASRNPKYCYNWSFENLGKSITFCIWHPEITISGSSLIQANNLRNEPVTNGVSLHVWNRRAAMADKHLQFAYLNRLPVNAIILDGIRRDRTNPEANASRVKRRALDTVQWAVTEYDFVSGDYILTRGAMPVTPFSEQLDEEIASFKEGTSRRAFRLHRYRERRARKVKIQQTLKANGGRLVCEVPNCGFDFAKRYGSLGEGYAQIHHTIPLSSLPKEGGNTKLSDLAIVCANCHVMIHVGGQCRDLPGLIASS